MQIPKKNQARFIESPRKFPSEPKLSENPLEICSKGKERLPVALRFSFQKNKNKREKRKFYCKEKGEEFVCVDRWFRGVSPK